MFVLFLFFFFFKQKTAYEMRISDWSSDVCSSDLLLEALLLVVIVVVLFLQTWRAALIPVIAVPVAIIGSFAAMSAFGFSINTLTLFGLVLAVGIVEIGRASCRERVCQYV